MKYPLVSVIINCLNCEEYVSEAINSVYKQTYPNWEIIFWDNASTDKSAEIAQNYDARLKYFASPQTVPLGQARNWALEKANGEYIAFLDADDIWLPTKLEKQIPLFENDPQVGIVISDSYFFNEKGIQRQPYKRAKVPTGYIWKELLKNYFIIMSTAVIRKKALNSLDHFFDPQFNLIEEMDLFLRIAYSWKLDCVYEPLGMWRMHSNSWSMSRFYLFPKERKILLNKCRRIFPELEKYEDIIRAVEATIARDKAIFYHLKGESSKARKILKPYKTHSPKYSALYLLLFLPQKVYMYIQKIRGTPLPCP